jgi:cytochrome P450
VSAPQQDRGVGERSGGLAGPVTHDAFRRYLRSMTVTGRRNPYAAYARYRAHDPVFRGGITALLRGSPSKPSESAVNEFVVFRLNDVQGVLRDRAAFSSACYADVMPTLFGGTLAAMDDPEHHTYRGLVAQAFSPQALERWEHALVTPLVNGLIDEFVEDGSAELVRQLTFPFPIRVIAAILGLPSAEMDAFQELAVQLFDILTDWQRAADAAQHLGSYLASLVAERRGTEGDDVITALSKAAIGPRSLTDQEIVDFCRLLLPAGAETTFRAANSLLVGLLSHPEQLEALREDPALLTAAVEESLRWEPPFTTVIRTARRDVTIGDTFVPRGSFVYASLGSANHDERQWSDPEQFNIFRRRSSHVAFGSGPHTCLGIHLARLELRVLLTAVLARLPGIRLDPSKPAPVIVGTFGRTPSEIWALFDGPPSPQ